MNERTFDKKKHAEDVFEASRLVCFASMVAEAMQPANNQMGEYQYCTCAAGIFGLMEFALSHAHELLSETEEEFRHEHSLSYKTHQYTPGPASPIDELVNEGIYTLTVGETNAVADFIKDIKEKRNAEIV